MEQGKSKYEVAKENLEKFGAVSVSIEAAKDANTKPEKFAKALDWYLEQYKKVLRTMDNS